jgi:hypothetical protein
MTSQIHPSISKETLTNTESNARQQSNSSRTIACHIEPHVSPPSTQPSFQGGPGRNDPEVGQSPIISLASTAAGDRKSKHDSKIKFSDRTKKSDQSLTKPQWRQLNKETTEEERDVQWRKLDPNTPNYPETEELEVDWWNEWKNEKKEAKMKQRAQEKRAIPDAPGGGKSSQKSEQLSELDEMQSGKLGKNSNGSEAARRTRASSIEIPLRHRKKPAEASSGHASVGRENFEHAGTVLPCESGEEAMGTSNLYPDNAKQKLRRGRTFL